jgi:ribosomal protein L40E
MEKKETIGVVQLEWVCPNCSGRNPGPEKTCKNCGAPQPENVKFQRAADEKLITDSDTIKAAKSGADIHCGFCGTRNPAGATNCSQCGGDLKEGKRRQAGEALQSAPKVKIIKCTNCGTENPSTERNCKSCGSPLPGAQPSQPATAQASASKAQAQTKKPNWLLLGGIGALFLACCIAAIFLFVLPSRTVQGTVSDVHWITYVPVEQIEAVKYTDQSGSPPSDAYNLSCRTDTHEVCEEKTIDQGNGYGDVVKECHDVTEDICSYTRDEWQTFQTYTLEGSNLTPVYDNPSITSDQRIGTSSEELTVTFSTSDGQVNYTPSSVSEFQQYQPGSTWKLSMNAAGGILSVGK